MSAINPSAGGSGTTALSDEKVRSNAEFYNELGTKPPASICDMYDARIGNKSSVDLNFGSVKVVGCEVNGFKEVGLAAASEARLNHDQLLGVPGSDWDLCIENHLIAAFSSLEWPAGLDSVSKKLLDIGVAIIVSLGWHGYTGDTTTVADIRLISKIESISKDTLSRINEAVLGTRDAAMTSLIMPLIFATKVNVFTMNHHTGQGAASAYTRSMIKRTFGGTYTENPAYISAMHQIGHYVNTKMVFRRWFCDDITNQSKKRSNIFIAEGLRKRVTTIPVPSHDMRARISGMPSGAAKVGITYTALNKLACTVFFSCIDVIIPYRPTIALYNAIIADPIAYHLGSHYFLGEPPKPIFECDELAQALAVVFMSVCLVGTSLSKSSSMMKLEEARSLLPTVYAKMLNLQTQMMDQMINANQLSEILSLTGGYTTVNPIKQAFYSVLQVENDRHIGERSEDVRAMVPAKLTRDVDNRAAIVKEAKDKRDKARMDRDVAKAASIAKAKREGSGKSARDPGGPSDDEEGVISGTDDVDEAVAQEDVRDPGKHDDDDGSVSLTVVAEVDEVAAEGSEKDTLVEDDGRPGSSDATHESSGKGQKRKAAKAAPQDEAARASKPRVTKRARAGKESDVE